MMSGPGYAQEQDRCQIGRETKHTDYAHDLDFLAEKQCQVDNRTGFLR